MWLLEEKTQTVENREKWWITELPMRRTWRRIDIPLSPCRLGNYLLILGRTAPKVASPNLLMLLLLCFFPEKRLLNEFKAMKRCPSRSQDLFCCSGTFRPKNRLWAPSSAQTWAADGGAPSWAFEHGSSSSRKDPRRQTEGQQVSYTYLQYIWPNIVPTVLEVWGDNMGDPCWILQKNLLRNSSIVIEFKQRNIYSTQLSYMYIYTYPYMYIFTQFTTKGYFPLFIYNIQDWNWT